MFNGTLLIFGQIIVYAVLYRQYLAPKGGSSAGSGTASGDNGGGNDGPGGDYDQDREGLPIGSPHYFFDYLDFGKSPVRVSLKSVAENHWARQG